MLFNRLQKIYLYKTYNLYKTYKTSDYNEIYVFMYIYLCTNKYQLLVLMNFDCFRMFPF